MARGRKPNTPKLTAIKGGRGVNSGKEAAITSATIAMPVVEMTPEELEHFNLLKEKLAPNHGDSDTFAHIITLCAKKLAELEECEAFISEKGKFYETETVSGAKMLKKNPAVNQRSECIRDIKGFLAEMGLTQTAIGKVGGGGSAKPSNVFGSFGKANKKG